MPTVREVILAWEIRYPDRPLDTILIYDQRIALKRFGESRTATEMRAIRIIRYTDGSRRYERLG